MEKSKRRRIIWILTVLGVIILSCLYVSNQEIQAISFRSTSVSSIYIDFTTGEVDVGWWRPNIEPGEEEMEEYFTYINDIIPKLIWKETRYQLGFFEKINAEPTRSFWIMHIHYANRNSDEYSNSFLNKECKQIVLSGNYAYPKEWQKLIEKTNELIGEDLLDSSTYDYPVK